MLTNDDKKFMFDLMDQKFDQKLAPIHKDIKIIKKNVKKLRKDLDGTINMADHGLLNVQTRLKAVEKHVGFPDYDFA